MTTHTAPPAPDPLRDRLRGALLRPGEEGYDRARAAWNLNAQHTPALVVLAEDAGDVRAAVRHARDAGLGVAVMATGHGTAAPCDGGLLINTSRMTGVRIDPVTRTARVGAGARWSDVLPGAAAHGLAGLVGSSSGVGVVGYTLGGGFGWLGRHYGFASGAVVRAEVVTADGELVTATAQEDPDLFRGLRGGAGGVGVVTALEFTLQPLDRVYGGNLYYPVHRARELLECVAQWSRTLPDEMAAAATFRRFPPAPAVPEALRARSFVAVRACWSGPDPADGERLLAPVRAALGPPAVDTFAVLPATGTDVISMDPVQPLRARQHSELLHDLTPATVEGLIASAVDSPLAMLEVRLLGGALSRPSTDVSPIAHSAARYTMNAIGATPDADADRAVQAHLAGVAAAMRPHATGETYVNFLELGGATPERVRAAYSPADRARLVALKERLDPHDLFRYHRPVAPSGGPS